MENQSFKDFIHSTLVAAMPEEIASLLVMPEPLEVFLRAFTHYTFVMDRAGKMGKFDYEILEKVGDRILAGSFQLWLFDILGFEVDTPQIYADIEKEFTGSDFLSALSTNLGFEKFIRLGPENKITGSIKEDVFESFIGAIVLTGDKYITTDMGMPLAKRWIYQVYNTYARDKIDPRNPSKYVNFRSRVNELWLFNGWGTPKYVTSGQSKGARELGLQRKAAANLMGPNVQSFPAEYRGRPLGSGAGDDIDDAREAAAKAALEMLELTYVNIKGLEESFGALETVRFEKFLKDNPELLEKVKAFMKTRADSYSSVAIRKQRIFGIYVVQLRVRVDGIWRNGARARSKTSEQEAVDKVFQVFISKGSEGQV